MQRAAPPRQDKRGLEGTYLPISRLECIPLGKARGSSPTPPEIAGVRELGCGGVALGRESTWEGGILGQ